MRSLHAMTSTAETERPDGRPERARRRLPRTVAMAVAVFALVSGAVVLGAPAASANTCTDGLCGQVKNRTGLHMYITENLGYGSNYCDVWNWGGYTTYSWMHAHCDQEWIGNGTYGGNFTGIDVDAFTFPNQGYHERFGRLGTWHWRTHGVWTKFESPEIADCGIGDGNEIWCTVLLQP